MRRKIITFFLIIIAFLLQSTFFRSFTLLTITPNLLLMLTAIFGFMNGKSTGMWVGFFSGLMIDLFYCNLFGFHALVYMYIGYMNGMLYEVFFDEDIKVPIVLVAVSDLAYSLIYYLVQFAFRARLGFSAYLTHTILPEIIFTALLTLVLYRPLFLLNKKLVAVEVEEQSPWLRR